MPARRAATTLAAAASLLAAFAPAASAWSPTPTQILYQSHTGGDYEVAVMNPDGSGARQLTNNNLPDNDPTWSPRGLQIVWMEATPGHAGDLFVGTPSASNQTMITHQTNQFARSPSWTPDGKTIYFYRSSNYTPGGGASAGDIYSISVDPTSPTGWGVEAAVTGLSDSLSWEGDPEVSPKGDKIAYVNDPDGSAGPLKQQIWVADLVNGAAVNGHRVTTGTQREMYPTWSADETQLAFTRDSLYTINLQTGRETKINSTTSAFPDWSTSSPNEIVFDAYNRGNWDIAKVTLGGKHGPVTTTLTASPDDDSDANW